MKSQQIKSNHNKSNEITTNQIKSQQIKSNHNKSNQIKSQQIKSNQITTNQIKSNQINLYKHVKKLQNASNTISQM